MGTTFYHISERSVERVAEVAASSVPGTLAVDAKLAGLAGRSFPRIDVHLDRQSGVAAIEAEIATAYPAPIAAITDAVRATVISHVRTLTGLDVSRVNVSVSSVEAQDPNSRVTWDDVASHSAFAIPTPIKVNQLKVTSPVTRERQPLKAIHARSLVDDMWEFNTPHPTKVASVHAPAEPTARSIRAPKPMDVQTKGFVAAGPGLRGVDKPAPAQPWSPRTPEPRVPAPFTVNSTQLKRVRVPEPAAVRRTEVPPRRRLTEITAAPLRLRKVETRPARPLRKVTVNATPLREPQVPTPQRVVRPRAPRPQPLKQISITPVVNKYDRTR